MVQNMMTVGAQALVLLLLMLTGLVCGKRGLLGPAAVTGMTNLVLYVALPCSLIRAFELELTPQTLLDLLISMAAAFGCLLFSFLAASLLIREKSPSRRKILTLAATFTNCNFMAFPLQTALIGPTGIFYGSAYAMATPLLFWTGGIVYLEGDRKAFSWRNAVLNPGTVGLTGGLALFLGRVTLPGVLDSAMSHLANLAVPLPMLIVGCQLARTDFRRILKDRMGWVATLLRLLVLPLAALGLLYAFGVRGSVLVATAIAASAPSATLVAMMAQKCGREPQLAAELVSLQTLASIATMPVVVGLAQLLA
ncbi:MAG: AEC family transporter [Oscillibacter sp.]|nr:AEC family transporter [Oscillibacter sp.]